MYIPIGSNYFSNHPETVIEKKIEFNAKYRSKRTLYITFNLISLINEKVTCWVNNKPTPVNNFHQLIVFTLTRKIRVK